MTDLPPNKVLLRQGGLSGRIYAVTRWKDDGKGNITAITKTDVTDQFEALVKSLGYVFHSDGDVR